MIDYHEELQDLEQQAEELDAYRAELEEQNALLVKALDEARWLLGRASVRALPPPEGRATMNEWFGRRDVWISAVRELLDPPEEP